MKISIRNIFLTLSVFTIALNLSGCSLFGKGKKDSADDQAALSENDLDKRYGLGNIPNAEADGLFKDVRFDYDSSSINDSARQTIEANVQILQQNPNMTIKLEGHCDERGTAEYNMALGSVRAKAVMEVLASFGIARNRISTISYGEEIPLDPGHDEDAWSTNRRVHFGLVSK
jgi:peptidoglycan-associated lipoprotein